MKNRLSISFLHHAMYRIHDRDFIPIIEIVGIEKQKKKKKKKVRRLKKNWTGFMIHIYMFYFPSTVHRREKIQRTKPQRKITTGMRWMAFSPCDLPWRGICFLATSDIEWCIGNPTEAAIFRDEEAKAVVDMSTKNSPDALEILEDLCMVFQMKE